MVSGIPDLELIAGEKFVAEQRTEGLADCTVSELEILAHIDLIALRNARCWVVRLTALAVGF